jgi:LacI family transcriptional regulator
MSERRQVAVIIHSELAYHRKILRGIGAYMHEVGNWSLYIEDQPLHKLPDLNNWEGDGIILAFKIQSVINTACRMRLPTVGIEGESIEYDPTSRIPNFRTDNAAIGRLGAQYLIERGFARLAFCGFPSTGKTPWCVERAMAFQKCAREHRLPCVTYTGHVATVRKWINLQHELTAWLESLEKPVGLLAANDDRARHVLEACRASGLRVPEDVAVLGVDNDEVMCELTNPPLSSIEHGATSLGYQAAAQLDRLMAGKKARKLRTLVAPEGVVTRHSTDVLAIADPDVAAAMAFIHQHSCEPIGVANVVDAVGASRSTLEARFKSVGRTIHGEIQRLRVERARFLIATTDLPIKKIATMAGFTYARYMTTIFRQSTGWTPAEYRKHVRL